MNYDVFISHASEDKRDVAEPLKTLLEKMGLKVWFDATELTIGDSLRRSIDHGLSHSNFGIVVLSHAFFSKEWPQRELDALVARDDGKQKVILPVWHDVSKDDILRYSPLLADRLGVSSSNGIEFMAAQILRAIVGTTRVEGELHRANPLSQSGPPLSVGQNFTTGLSEILSRHETLTTVDILAYTSTSYFKAIEDSNVHIKRLRVLIRDPNTIESMQFPSDPLAKKQFVSEIEQRVSQWKVFRDEGRVEDFQIRYYSFDSLIYFLLTNDSLLHFGFLVPREKPGPNVTAPLSSIGPNKPGDHLFKCNADIFNAVWKHFSR